MKKMAILMTLALVAMAAGSASALMYEITVTDDIAGGPETGQPFSPPVAAVHNSDYELWMPGSYASPGLILVAEEGDPSVLAAEAMASPDVHAVEIGSDGPFFDQVVFMIEGEPGDEFSVAWMLGRTNDLFSGVYDITLPPEGTTLELQALAWDAGSEVNTGMIEDLGFYGNPMTGPDEDNPIQMIDTYTIYNDPDYGMLTWDFPPCGHVTIEPMGGVANDASTWSQVKAQFD